MNKTVTLLSENSNDFMKQGADVNAVGSQGLDLSLEDIILPESREDRVPFIALQVIDG